MVSILLQNENILSNMKIVTCYRIEHEDGYGLFFKKLWDNKGNIIGNRHVFGEKDFPDLWARHTMGFKNPEQENLQPIKDGKEYFCAFPTLTSVKYWIKPEHLALLKSLGFSVLRLNVTDYQIGKFQILYTKQSIVKSINITEYL